MTTIKTERSGTDIKFSTTGCPDLFLNVASLTDDVREIALYDRLTQKVVDAAAKSRDPKTGAPASPSVKYEAMRAVIAMLHSGDWTVGSSIYDVLATVLGKSRVEMRTWFDGLTDEEKKAVRGSQRVRDEIARRRGPADESLAEAVFAKLDI
jgi:hypothetical protein